VPVPHTAQWPYLEFAVLELPLLVRQQLNPYRCRRSLAKTSAAVQRKDRRSRFRHDLTPEISGNRRQPAAADSAESK
jgi:hypothetical protein